jgi:hypothetical protein
MAGNILIGNGGEEAINRGQDRTALGRADNKSNYNRRYVGEGTAWGQAFPAPSTPPICKYSSHFIQNVLASHLLIAHGFSRKNWYLVDK